MKKKRKLNSIYEYLTLFSVPFLVIVYALLFAVRQNVGGWEGVIAAIWIMFGIAAALFTGLFILLNKWLKWNLSWWTSLLLSIAIFIVSSLIISQLIRYSS